MACRMPDGIRSEMTLAAQRHLLRRLSNTASGMVLFPETAPDLQNDSRNHCALMFP
jgi:hypothetical protein